MKMTTYLESVIRRQVDEPAWKWLAEKGALVNRENSASALQQVFALIPGKTGHKQVEMVTAQAETDIPELHIQGWTTDRLCRVWLIIQLDARDKTSYLQKTNSLFSGASMNELVALYSALPALAWPEEWKLRCAEGIRSNIGTVLEAIMYDNNYPSRYLDEPAFNQMVLKAFFTEKNADRIIGLDQRANRKLAAILSDYAHERWAADRSVEPQLWRLTGKFLNAGNFPDIQRLWNKGNTIEKKAALLACSESDYPLARQLWENGGDLKKEMLEKKITWHNLKK